LTPGNPAHNKNGGKLVPLITKGFSPRTNGGRKLEGEPANQVYVENG